MTVRRRASRAWASRAIPLLVLLAGVAAAPPGQAYPRPGSLVLASASGSVRGDDDSGVNDPSEVSADGRYVAFASAATNLVPGDRNGEWDVFLADVRSRRVERLSAAPGGRDGIADPAAEPARMTGSQAPRLTPSGRYVAFHSDAYNLVPGDRNGDVDVFVRDQRTRRTELVSKVALRAPDAGVTVVGGAYPALSDDGRWVAYEAVAQVPGAEDPVLAHIVLFDRATRTGRVVTRTSGGALCAVTTASTRPAISADGRYVAFLSTCDPANGNRVLDDPQAYVYDRTTGTRVLASVGTDGTVAETGATGVDLSGNGRVVAFASRAANLAPTGRGGIFVRDVAAQRTERVSVTGAGALVEPASEPRVSRDGRLVAFTAVLPGASGDLASGEAVAVVHDRVARTTWTESTSSAGTARAAVNAALSADGSYVVFASTADNLVAGDENGVADVFVRTRGPGLGSANTVVAVTPTRVRASGDAVFSGRLIGAVVDSQSDASSASHDIGQELVGMEVYYHREDARLLFRWLVESLPSPFGAATPHVGTAAATVGRTPEPVGGSPLAQYVARFQVASVPYELRVRWAEDANATKAPPLRLEAGLYRCEQQPGLRSGDCLANPVAVSGGIGTAGTEVRAAVPLSALVGLAEGGSLTALEGLVRAVGSHPAGEVEAPLDRTGALTLTIPTVRVTLAVTSPQTRTRRPSVVSATPAGASRFALAVPTWRDARRRAVTAYQANLTVCLGDLCTTRRVR